MSRRLTSRRHTPPAFWVVNDYDVLAHAARAGRLLVTHDFYDMPQHFAAYIQAQTSAGVLLVPQRLPVMAVVEDLS